MEQKNIKMEARIEAIYSQDTKYEQYEFPLEVKVEVTQDRISFWSGEAEVERVSICQEYPIIEFIRKTFCSVLFNYNEK